MSRGVSSHGMYPYPFLVNGLPRVRGVRGASGAEIPAPAITKPAQPRAGYLLYRTAQTDVVGF